MAKVIMLMALSCERSLSGRTPLINHLIILSRLSSPIHRIPSTSTYMSPNSPHGHGKTTSSSSSSQQHPTSPTQSIKSVGMGDQTSTTSTASPAKPAPYVEPADLPRPLPEGVLQTTSPLYDCIQYIIYCNEHQNIAVTNPVKVGISLP